MPDRNNDVVMYMTLDSGALAAEARTELDTTNDDMVQDFQKGKFFELRSFSFGVRLYDKADEERRREDTASSREDVQPRLDSKNGSDVPFKAFLEGGSSSKSMPVELGEISYERNMDKGSALLWNYFVAKKTVTNAVIVKRKDTGSEGGPQGYLALKFQDLLITGIDWEEGDVVIERCKMVCRSAQILYKRQLPSNDLDSSIGFGWGYINGAF